MQTIKNESRGSILQKYLKPLVVVFLAATLFLNGCGTMKQVRDREKPTYQRALMSIEMLTPPDKLTYAINDALDITGLQVQGTYSDGTNELIAIDPAANLSGYDMTAAGNYNVLIDVQGKTASFNIVVEDISLTGIRIDRLPDRLEYLLGENIVLDGLSVLGKYSDDSEKQIQITLANVSPVTLLTETNNQLITIDYSGFTATFNVEVQDIAITHIIIAQEPDKQTYNKGNTLDQTGLIVKGVQNNAELITLVGYTVSPVSLNQVGTQIITVTYQEHTATFDVIVGEAVVYKIGVYPAELSYASGQQFLKSALTVTAYYTDDPNTAKVVDINDFATSIVDGTSLTEIGVIPLTVTYADYSKVITLNVSEAVFGDLVVELPDYKEGDEFEKDEITVYEELTDGTTNDVTSEVIVNIPDGTVLTQNVTLNVETGGTSKNVVVEINKITAVSVTQPTKHNYNKGELFDAAGMIMTVAYEHGVPDEFAVPIATNSKFQIIPAHGAILAEINSNYGIDVSYLSYIASTAVNVGPAIQSGITVNINSPQVYNKGESLASSSITVLQLLSDGTTGAEITDYAYQPQTFAETGTQVLVTITSGIYTATFNAEVNGSALKSLRVERNGNLDYPKGAPLNVELWELYAEYTDAADNKVFNLTDSEVTVVPAHGAALTMNGTASANYWIKVDYDGMTTYATVNVTEAQINGIAVKTLPTKTTYAKGNELELAGLQISVNYTDNSAQVKTYGADAGINITGYNKNSLGEQTLTVTYEGFTAVFSVNVGNAEVKDIIVEVPDYKEGDEFVSSDIKVIEELSDGTTLDVTDGTASMNIPDGTVLTDDVTIIVETEDASKNVTIVVDNLASLFVTQRPKINYDLGDNLDLTGLKVKAVYESADERELTYPNPKLIVIPDHGAQLTEVSANYFIDISYISQMTSTTVNVGPARQTGITISHISKTGYNKGEAIDRESLTVEATYTYGSNQAILDYELTPNTLNVTGSITVIVSQNGFSDTFEVHVDNSKLNDIQVNKGGQLIYPRGAALNVSGWFVQTIYSDPDDNTTINLPAALVTIEPANGAALLPTGTSANYWIKVEYGEIAKFVTVSVTEPELAGLSIDSSAADTEYALGEDIVTAGLQVFPVMTDGTTLSATTNYSIAPAIANATGALEITVQLNDTNFTAAYAVNVGNAEVKDLIVIVPPYDEGDTFVSSDIKVIEELTDGTTRDAVGEVSVNIPDGTTLNDDTEITVEVEDRSATENISVSLLERIEITKQPDTQSYAKGALLDLNGMEITAYWESGNTKTLALPNAGVLAAPDQDAVLNVVTENQVITVFYISKMAETTVVVRPAEITGIAVAKGTALDEYALGEDIVTAGLIVSVNWTDNTQTLTENYSITPTTAAETSGNFIITVKLNGHNFTGAYSVNVGGVEVIDGGLEASSVKQIYDYGEDILVDVTVNYTDGTIAVWKNVAENNDKELSISGYDKNQLNPAQAISVEYKNKEVSFTVGVQDVLDSLVAAPKQAVYNFGSPIDAWVTANYLSGAQTPVTDYDITYNIGIGAITAEVSYENKTASFAVTVNDVLNGISIAVPAQTVYAKGAAFDATGLRVTADWAYAGGQLVAEDFDLALQGAALSDGMPLNNVPGEYTVSVNYLDKSAAFNITITEAQLLSIEVSQPQGVYYEHSTLNVTGMIVTASYTDRVVRIALPSASVETLPANGAELSAGEQVITVSYLDQTALTTITVLPLTDAQLTGISITQKPQDSYFQGDTLDLTAMVVEGTYSNGYKAQLNNWTALPADGAALNAVTESLQIAVAVNAHNAATTVSVLANSSDLSRLTGIEASQPVPNSYNRGNLLNMGAVIVTAHYSNGWSEQTTDWQSTPAHADSLMEEGIQNITINIIGNDTHFATVTVNVLPAVLTNIEVGWNSLRSKDYVLGQFAYRTVANITANYSDGWSRSIPTDDPGVSYEPERLPSDSPTPITVNFTEGGITSYANEQLRGGNDGPIGSVREPQYISIAHDIDELYEGDPIPVNTIAVTVYYNDDSSEPTENYNITPLKAGGSDPQIVSVALNNRPDINGNFSVAVNTITSFESSQPNKTIYFNAGGVSTSLDMTGATATVNYSNGHAVAYALPAEDIVITPAQGASFDGVAPSSNYFISVAYGNHAAFVTVNIQPVAVSAIAVAQPPAKLGYVQGENLNLNGLIVSAEYNNGATSANFGGYTTLPLDNAPLNATGEQTVTISLSDDPAVFTTLAVNVAPIVPVSLKITDFSDMQFAGETVTLNAEDRDGNDRSLLAVVSYNNGTVGNELIVIDDVAQVYPSTVPNAYGPHTFVVSHEVDGVTVTGSFTAEDIRVKLLPISFIPSAETDDGAFIAVDDAWWRVPAPVFCGPIRQEDGTTISIWVTGNNGENDEHYISNLLWSYEGLLEYDYISFEQKGAGRVVFYFEGENGGGWQLVERLPSASASEWQEVRITLNQASFEAQSGHNKPWPTQEIEYFELEFIGSPADIQLRDLKFVKQAVTDLTIAQPPAKTAYTQNEVLSLNGLVVRADYNNGAVSADFKDFVALPADNSPLTEIGEQTVTISLSGDPTVFATLTVNVVPIVPVSLTIVDSVDTQTAGEPVEIDDGDHVLQFKVVYSNGSISNTLDATETTILLTPSTMPEYPDYSVPLEIVVEYEGVTGSFEVDDVYTRLIPINFDPPTELDGEQPATASYNDKWLVRAPQDFAPLPEPMDGVLTLHISGNNLVAEDEHFVGISTWEYDNLQEGLYDYLTFEQKGTGRLNFHFEETYSATGEKGVWWYMTHSLPTASEDTWTTVRIPLNDTAFAPDEQGHPWDFSDMDWMEFVVEGINANTSANLHIKNITFVKSAPTGISIAQLPAKTYSVGESILPADILVSVNYNVGISSLTTNFSLSPATLTTAGDQTVTVSAQFDGQSYYASFVITVQGQPTMVPISLDFLGDTTSEQIAGEPVELDDGEGTVVQFTVTYSDGETTSTSPVITATHAMITPSVMPEYPNYSVPLDIVVEYDGVTNSFEVDEVYTRLIPINFDSPTELDGEQPATSSYNDKWLVTAPQNFAPLVVWEDGQLALHITGNNLVADGEHFIGIGTWEYDEVQEGNYEYLIFEQKGTGRIEFDFEDGERYTWWDMKDDLPLATNVWTTVQIPLNRAAFEPEEAGDWDGTIDWMEFAVEGIDENTSADIYIRNITFIGSAAPNGISIALPPETTYYVGDSISPADILVSVNYNIGTSSLTTNFSLFPTTLPTSGDQTVTVSVKIGNVTHNATVTINVVEPVLESISAHYAFDNRGYYLGEQIVTFSTTDQYGEDELTGDDRYVLRVTANYSNGSARWVTGGYTLEPATAIIPQNGNAGGHTVTVNYLGKTATFKTDFNLHLTPIAFDPPVSDADNTDASSIDPHWWSFNWSNNTYPTSVNDIISITSTLNGNNIDNPLRIGAYLSDNPLTEEHRFLVLEVKGETAEAANIKAKLWYYLKSNPSSSINLTYTVTRDGSVDILPEWGTWVFELDTGALLNEYGEQRAMREIELSFYRDTGGTLPLNIQIRNIRFVSENPNASSNDPAVPQLSGITAALKNNIPFFAYGDTITNDQVIVTATYSDGSAVGLAAADYELDRAIVTGSHNTLVPVNVAYNGKTAVVNPRVYVAQNISINRQPRPTEYYQDPDTTLSLRSMEVMAVYATSGANARPTLTRNIDIDDLGVVAPDNLMSSTGNKRITVNYEDTNRPGATVVLTTNFNISVTVDAGDLTPPDAPNNYDEIKWQYVFAGPTDSALSRFNPEERRIWKVDRNPNRANARMIITANDTSDTGHENALHLTGTVTNSDDYLGGLFTYIGQDATEYTHLAIDIKGRASVELELVEDDDHNYESDPLVEINGGDDEFPANDDTYRAEIDNNSNNWRTIYIPLPNADDWNIDDGFRNIANEDDWDYDEDLAQDRRAAQEAAGNPPDLDWNPEVKRGGPRRTESGGLLDLNIYLIKNGGGNNMDVCIDNVRFITKD